MRLSRQNVLLLVLLVMLGLLAWQRLGTSDPAGEAPSASGRATPAAPPRAAARTAGAPQASSGTPAAPSVRLAALGAEREEPGNGRRNPFLFERPAPVAVAPAPVPIQLPVPEDGADAPGSAGQSTGPPPPPAITLKFIGVVQRGDGVSLAVLSPGEGMGPLYGREGDIIEGRYRLVRIGPDSLDIEYADGRGRQTLKLSGQ